MKDKPDHLRVVGADERMVPAIRFSQMAAEKKAEQRRRIAAEGQLTATVLANGRLLLVLDRLVRNLPDDERERLNGVGIGGAGEMTDIQLGALLTRIDAIMADKA